MKSLQNLKMEMDSFIKHVPEKSIEGGWKSSQKSGMRMSWNKPKTASMVMHEVIIQTLNQRKNRHSVHEALAIPSQKRVSVESSC